MSTQVKDTVYALGLCKAVRSVHCMISSNNCVAPYGNVIEGAR